MWHAQAQLDRLDISITSEYPGLAKQTERVHCVYPHVQWMYAPATSTAPPGAILFT